MEETLHSVPRANCTDAPQHRCITCRQRKVRCDRKKPTCGFCSRAGLRCQFAASQVRPGLRTGYVAQLENRISSLEQEFQDFRKALRGSGSLQQPPQNLSPTESAGGGISGPAPTEPDASSLAAGSPATAASIPPYPDLSKSAVDGYCSVWFKQYHSWFPILHQPTVLESCQDISSSGPVPIVLKAIVVVIVPSQAPPDGMTEGQQQIAVRMLSDEIILEGHHNLSLQSLQALLVLSVAEYGAGRMAEFYNLISVCKRISTQLGLRDLVALNCINFGVASPIPPRMLRMPTSAVEREEKVRAYWATDALDSASTTGAAWHLSVARPEPTASAPCDDEIWQYPESVITMYQFSSAGAPSSFSLFVRLVTNELWHVHNFLQHCYDTTSVEDLQRRRGDCDAIYDLLMGWHGDFEQILMVSTPPFTDLFTPGGTTGQHSNSTLIHCTIYSAIICLYQQFVFEEDKMTAGEQDARLSWPHATERCLSSCDHMAAIIRGVDDSTLESANPLITYCIFVAARFYIAHARATASSVPNKIFLLVYALRICGQRWRLARQLHTVLEGGLAESAGTSGSRNHLPAEFWNLKYLSLDIYEALKNWVTATGASSPEAVV